MTDTRTALLDAASRSFATAGYAGTSIRALAASVDIKESSVYNHFAGKQALLDAVVARAEEQLAAVGATFAVSLDDAGAAASVYATITLDRLEAVATGLLDAWLHDPAVVAARRVLTLEQYRTPEAGELLRGLLVRRPLEFQSHLFADLMATGHFRSADPDAVALAFWGPLLALMTLAEAPDAEPEARRLLRAHLAHFRRTHLSSAPTDQT